MKMATIKIRFQAPPGASYEEGPQFFLGLPAIAGSAFGDSSFYGRPEGDSPFRVFGPEISPLPLPGQDCGRACRQDQRNERQQGVYHAPFCILEVPHRLFLLCGIAPKVPRYGPNCTGHL